MELFFHENILHTSFGDTQNVAWMPEKGEGGQDHAIYQNRGEKDRGA